MLQFGPWLPDLPELQNPGALVAKNVLPRSASYSPMSGGASYSDALSARCQGGFATKSLSGSVSVFAGDETKLYRSTDGSSWDDVSVGGGYATNADDRWSFAQFGNRVVATNYSNNLQSYVIGASTDFAELTAIKAKHVAVVRDFVMIGNTYDGTDAEQSQRVRWSAINDPTSWSVSATTQADYQDLVGDGGAVMALIGGASSADVVILQERAVWRGNYVGTPLIFAFDRVENGRGCMASGSVCQHGGRFFYLAEDGFYMSDGVGLVPIGHDAVNKWFLARLNTGYVDRISSLIDPINQMAIWSYPSQSSSGINDELIIYNWAANRWSYGELDAEFIFSSLTSGTDLDSISGSLESLAFGLDSTVWKGGRLRLAYFNDNHEMGFLTGSALAATIDTTEGQIAQGRRSLVTEVWPKVDGGTTTVQIGTRNLPTDSVTWSSAASVNNVGFAPVRSDARFHRVRINIAAGGSWTHAQGVDVKTTSSGWR